MDPINYRLDVANPLENAVKGYQAGFGIRAANEARDLAQTQQQTAMAQQERKREVLRNLINNPNAGASEYANAALEVPEMHAQFKQAWDTKNTAQQKTILSDLTQWATAIQQKKPEVAEKMISARADALENAAGAPTEESKRYRAQAEMVRESPEFASTMMLGMMQAHPDGGKVIDSIVKMGGERRADQLQPALVDKGVADASTAQSEAKIKGVDAKYADSKALLDVEKKGWDIKKIKADIDIARESNRIATMNAVANRESNALKRQELQAKIGDAVREREEKIAGKVAQAETEIAGVTDTIALIDEIFADPNSLKAVTGASAWKGAIPGTDNRTMAGKVDQLTNMLAAANLDKLKGPMSDKDILFVKRISGNIDRYQDEDKFAAELTKVRDIMKRAETKLRTKYGAPEAKAPAKPSAGAPGATQNLNIRVDF
jgi:hypothetical protein